MRWSIQTLVYITLAAAFGTSAFAQRGFGEGRGGGGAAVPSSTAAGMGASMSGRAARPSSTAIGAGAPVRSGFGRSTGYYGSRGSNTYRAGYGRRRDYRNVPFAYFMTPYYYPFLDYGSAPYGGEPEDMPYDPSADTTVVTQNLMGEQIQRLTDEIEQLRYAQQQPEQQAMIQAPAAPPPPPVIPLTVVLRDGQKLQVQNYAVMDHTFWDFSKQPARKIPISSIDVSASSQATAASGGEFPELNSK
jgi:hypothetical protein